ncbi:cellulose binding domain-containing protein [Actinocorallia sp. API 0066]|uniref:cellulose binding domain-containing protein n=1 Tax=Actinocorallia sp. API 0066 TaxID=2896846 RepID=UPI001E63DE18|nr:cellulose binding domain-containing protein [Actinocorallia sp. API 0066]MCD0448368.1 cellulose binding domain-containing protein [Actinocorallia sp. API 0066]
MGRHTKFWDRPRFADAPPAPSPAGKVRMAWIGRTPLMPVLAGVGAVGVVVAAYLTQQITLNLAGPGAGPESAACAGCEPLRAEVPGYATAEDPPTQGTEAADRSLTPPGLRAAFKLRGTTGSGFTATVTLRNTGEEAVSAWKLRFRIPNAEVHGAEGATVQTLAANGGTTLLTGAAPIGPGATLRLVLTGQGAWSEPVGCRVNGQKCR